MAKKQNSGLGRGLDSLIPKIEDIETDVEEGVSLEDLLKKPDDELFEDDIEEVLEKEADKEEVLEKEADKEEILEEKAEIEEVLEEEASEEKTSKVESIEENKDDIKDDQEGKEESSIYTNILNNDDEIIRENDEKIEEKLAAENDEENIKTTIDLKEENEETTKINEDENKENDIGSLLSEKEELLVYEVIETVENNPRITLWSAKSAAVLRYLRKTEPEFSISNEASNLIDEAIAKKYPEIWTLFNHL